MSNVILYTTEDGQAKIDLKLEDGTAWLSQLQIADLFSATKQNVSLHLKNIFEDDELAEDSVVKESLTTAADGKNYRTKLYNLVSAYFDLAKLNAIEEREMHMGDYLRELDTILSSTGRKILDNAGKISSTQAKEKAKRELQKYKALHLDAVEKDYLKTISALAKKSKEESRKKGGKV